jgi:hypothetical protein
MTYETNLADDASEEKQAALSYVFEAFAEARHDGLDGDCLAHAALFAAFKQLVDIYGEEAVAVFAEGLPERVRSGSFSVKQCH